MSIFFSLEPKILSSPSNAKKIISTLKESNYSHKPWSQLLFKSLLFSHSRSQSSLQQTWTLRRILASMVYGLVLALMLLSPKYLAPLISSSHGFAIYWHAHSLRAHWLSLLALQTVHPQTMYSLSGQEWSQLRLMACSRTWSRIKVVDRESGICCRSIAASMYESFSLHWLRICDYMIW